MYYGLRKMEGSKTKGEGEQLISDNLFDEALRDFKKLVGRISSHDYGTLKLYWEKKSFTLIAYMLRRYGIEFKGLTHLETVVTELIKVKNRRNEHKVKKGYRK